MNGIRLCSQSFLYAFAKNLPLFLPPIKTLLSPMLASGSDCCCPNQRLIWKDRLAQLENIPA